MLYPVFDYAEAHGPKIIGLLHDGIFCSGDWAPLIRKVKDLVASQSKKLLNVEVNLDCKAPVKADSA